MIGLQLALKSIVREPRRHWIAVLGVVSVLVPLLLIWSMKVGFVSGLMQELRSAPSNLELRLRGDYLLDAAKVDEVHRIGGVGFVIPTARMLATRAFASLEGGAKRTPVSLMPTAQGDPLLQGVGGGAVDDRTALVSRGLADRLGVEEGSTIEISNVRREQTETLRLRLRVSDVVGSEGIGGQWVFVSPDLVQAVEAFIDGYAVPRFGVDGKPPGERQPVYSSLRIYADRIENVASVAEGLQKLGFAVESNAARIENVLRLDRILSAVVIVLGAILLSGLSLSVWAGLAAILEQLRRHVALLGLMGAGIWNIGLYFIAIGLLVALCGTLAAFASAYVLMKIGNGWLSGIAGTSRPVFELPMTSVISIFGIVMVLQLIITLVVAARAATVHPREMLRDD